MDVKSVIVYYCNTSCFLPDTWVEGRIERSPQSELMPRPLSGNYWLKKEG